jgi:hypothetical protein
MSIYVPGKVTLAKEFTWNETVWNPSMITTALWLDAADASTITTVGGAVSQWNDKSGKGRNATQPTSGNRPTYQSSVQNSRNVIRFNAASSQFLTCSNTAGAFNYLHSGQGLIISVVKVGTTADPNALYGVLGNAGAFNGLRRGFSLAWDDRTLVPTSNRISTAAYDGLNNNVYSVGQSDILLPQSFGIAGALIDAANGIADNRVALLINGSTYTGNTSTATVSTGDASFDFQFGDYGTGFAYLQGDIGETIIVQGAVSTLNRQKLEGYLAHKWGLTANLPNDHPYKLVGPTP